MSIPTPQEIIVEAAPVLGVIREALRHGVARTRAYFDEEGAEPDPALAPNIVRWQAKRYFDSAGHAVHDLEEDYERPTAGNNGLRLSFKRFRLIIRKSDEGELPVPSSETQEKFYSYNLTFEFITLPEDQQINLVTLWDTDTTYSDLTSLDLVLPKQGGDRRDKTKAFWYTPILNLDAELAGSDLEDLSIERRDEEQNASGQE